MKIKKITIVKRPNTPDKVYLQTNLPTTLPGLEIEPLNIEFGAAPNYAESYCRRHFPKIPVDVIDVGMVVPATLQARIA